MSQFPSDKGLYEFIKRAKAAGLDKKALLDMLNYVQGAQLGQKLSFDLETQLYASIKLEALWAEITNVSTPDDSVLTQFAKLEITRIAFNEAPADKQALLKEFKKKSILQTISQDNRVVTWFFMPEHFLELTTKYPWLLDSNLGERSK